MPTKPTPGVYGILCLCNRKFYIGASDNIERRIAEHRSQLRGNRHAQLPRLQIDWNEFGEASFSFVRFSCPPDECARYEGYLIESLQTLEHEHGYNKMRGGVWGLEASIRNTEAKLIRARRFQRLPSVPAETPMSARYIATLRR